MIRRWVTLYAQEDDGEIMRSESIEDFELVYQVRLFLLEAKRREYVRMEAPPLILQNIDEIIARLRGEIIARLRGEMGLIN